MSSENIEFTKENIDFYLKEVAKEYRKLVGKNMPAELVLVGGASILINYGFRNSTTDIDAMISAASAMKDAINIIRDRFGLPAGWLNIDFQKTASYSTKLSQFSVYYKTYSNVVTIRTIAAEYLIAMKLCSGRQYKSDLSDILGILAEHQKAGTPITIEQIRKAVINLYEKWDNIPESSKVFIENVIENGQYEELYDEILRSEKETKELLIQFEKEYPDSIQKTNVDKIAINLQKKSDRASILLELREKKTKNNV